MQEERRADALNLLNAVDPPNDDIAAARHWHLQRALALAALQLPEKARTALDTLGRLPAEMKPARLWRDVVLALAGRRGADARLAAEAMQEAIDGMGPDGGGTCTLAAASPVALTSEIDALVFTPTAHQVAPGSTITTGFTLDVMQNGATTTNSTTSVIATAVNDAPTITGSATVSTNDEASVKPFTMTSISDPDIGLIETVELLLSNNGWAPETDADGTLSGTGLTKTGELALPPIH